MHDAAKRWIGFARFLDMVVDIDVRRINASEWAVEEAVWNGRCQVQEKTKLRVAVLFGGRSAEHEVSLQSAKNVVEAMDRTRFEPVLIGIDKDGIWHLNDAEHFLLDADNPKRIALDRTPQELSLVPGQSRSPIASKDRRREIGPIDVVFPVLHGPYGEDGSIQGLLKLANVPCVGAGVLGSAVGMDKDVMKRLLRDAGIPIADFLIFGSHQRGSMDFESIAGRIGLPFFIKPANLGSSVGVHKVKDRAGFDKAVADAFQYDRKVVIEENIVGREIECAVLGNENPIASIAGEVRSDSGNHDFYSYDAKYIDEKGAELLIPADLPEDGMREVQAIAIKAYQVLCCEGMARVDLFLKADGGLLVNEINTIPGFTKISMYPKLWEASGKPYTELISTLIELAIRRFEEEKLLKTSVG